MFILLKVFEETVVYRGKATAHMDDQKESDDGNGTSPPSADTTLPVGNKLYEQMLVREGKFGVWFTRANASNPEVWAEIVPEVFRRSVHATTTGVLRLLLAHSAGVGGGDDDGLSRRREKKAAAADDDDVRIDAAARSITDAMCLPTFRPINLLKRHRDDRYLAKPRGLPEPFELPLPFAAAVSRLGAVEVRSLTRRMVAAPAVPASAAASFLLEEHGPAGAGRRRWPSFDAHAYARAAAFARSLGVQFAPVDVAPRAGTAWWLLRGSADAGVFSLRCVLRESNYTDEDAIVHSMFCLDEQLRFGAELFRLDDGGGVAQGDYGSMLRNPHAGMNVNSFLALSDEPLRSMWKIG